MLVGFGMLWPENHSKEQKQRIWEVKTSELKPPATPDVCSPAPLQVQSGAYVIM